MISQNDTRKLKKRKSEKKGHSNTIIALIVIIAIIPAGIYYYNQQKGHPDDTSQWITSGPFAITNGTYRLGENVFMVVQGLKSNDVGNMTVLDPKGGTFAQVPFNGTEKSEFNYYFKPNTERIEKLCTPQDLVGKWTIVFKGTSYKSITFQVINDWVKGSQAEIKPINPC